VKGGPGADSNQEWAMDLGRLVCVCTVVRCQIMLRDETYLKDLKEEDWDNLVGRRYPRVVPEVASDNEGTGLAQQLMQEVPHSQDEVDMEWKVVQAQREQAVLKAAGEEAKGGGPPQVSTAEEGIGIDTERQRRLTERQNRETVERKSEQDLERIKTQQTMGGIFSQQSVQQQLLQAVP
jgi:hypothetical protein